MERNALIKSIWGCAHELGVGDEELHMILSRETGKDSMRAATDGELQKLLGAVRLYKDAKAVQRGGMTEKQHRYIKDLERKLGWAGDPSRLRGFVKKYAKVDSPKWLTLKRAGKIIEGLKSLLEQQKRQGDVCVEGK
jgi:hypothetical protein